MPNKAQYNADFWSSKILGYEAEGWSKKPTPFAEQVASYLATSSKILELGAGAGQDGLWFASLGHIVTLTDATTDAFERIREKARNTSVLLDLREQDVVAPLGFPDESFDLVYAHLVLHYFDNATMTKILAEIRRVLKPAGMVALLQNSIEDPEYQPEIADNEQGIQGTIYKRYFSVESLNLLVGELFETVVLDNQGHTPKDDAVGTGKLIRYIGKKRG